MKDFIGQPLKVGDRCVRLTDWTVKCTITRFTAKMVITETQNKSKTEKRCYSKDLISIEANYEVYPELLL